MGCSCILTTSHNSCFHIHAHLYLYRSVCVCVCVCVCVSFRRYTRRRLLSDRDQIWHTLADSSPNGSEPNKNHPCVTQGGFRGSEIQKSGITAKLPNNWHQILYVPADSFGNGHSARRIVATDIVSSCIPTLVDNVLTMYWTTDMYLFICSASL